MTTHVYDRGVVVLSLAIVVDEVLTPDAPKRYAVLAPWMDEPYEAASWEECYEEALRQRRTPRLSSAAE